MLDGHPSAECFKVRLGSADHSRDPGCREREAGRKAGIRFCFPKGLFSCGLLSLCIAIGISSADGVRAQQEFAEALPNVSSLGVLTCQQLWYLEQQVLAEGRVCLKSARARNAFRSAPRCISGEERILPLETQTYLAHVREASRTKRCPDPVPAR